MRRERREEKGVTVSERAIFPARNVDMHIYARLSARAERWGGRTRFIHPPYLSSCNFLAPQ